jgi:hypothetical protein
MPFGALVPFANLGNADILECCDRAKRTSNTQRPSTRCADGRGPASVSPEHAVIMVSEVSCALPGCPPIETIVVFWTDDAVRHRFKLFKPVAEVIANDLPSSFMKRALADTAEIGLECC